MTDEPITPDEAEFELSRLDPDDVSHLQMKDARGELHPDWHDALVRYLKNRRGYGQKSGSHRRGRRG